MIDRKTIASLIDQERLWRRHEAMAAIGGFGETGVNRQAFSAEDNQARRLLADWTQSLGFRLAVDAVGNLYVRYQPAGAAGDPVLTGSHMDSQPSGGRFDGIYGVLAGLEALEAIQASGVSLERPLEVVAWSNEEGSRFAPGAMGSMTFTGHRQLSDFLDSKDGEGASLRDALAESMTVTPTAEPREFGLSVHAYIETHVEQGPILEESGKTIGVVTGIQGCRWFEVEVLGEARHAGSTPLSVRKDALQAALRIVAKLNAWTADSTDTTRFTVGRFGVQPNSPNTVADRVQFSIDLRHPDSETLHRLGAGVEGIVREHSSPCVVIVTETFTHAPVTFPTGISATIGSVASKLNLDAMHLPSGAFHDAMFLADHCPTGMIFVPSHLGISHHPDEYTAPEDLADGAKVLAEVLVQLANSGACS